MNLFWMDASALAKRYVSEIGSPLMNHLFGRVPPLGMIGLLEGVGGVISILVRHRNAGRITQSAFHHALLDFRSEVSHCDDVEKVHPTPTQVSASWKHSGRYSLNSTDAVILRCALDKIIELRAGGNDLVLVTADVRLQKAAQAEGLLTFNPETDNQVALDALITSPPTSSQTF
jgi:predicted nucleic acid-binding protein